MTSKIIFHLTTISENLKNSGKLFRFKSSKIKLKFSLKKKYSRIRMKTNNKFKSKLCTILDVHINFFAHVHHRLRTYLNVHMFTQTFYQRSQFSISFIYVQLRSYNL